MIYSTKELLDLGESEYSIRCKLKSGELFLIERGIYSTDEGDVSEEVIISKKYPDVVLTGLTAFYIYDLTDYIPNDIYIASRQHSFPTRRKGVIQTYQDPSFFEVGIICYSWNDEAIRIYDLERTLIELIRLKEKYPKDIYYEVINSFRKKKDEIDFYKLREYLKAFTNGDNLLSKIKELI